MADQDLIDDEELTEEELKLVEVEPEAPEADPEPEAAEAAPEADPEEIETGEKDGFVKTVPHQALHAERIKRQAAEKRMATLEQRTQAMLDKFGAEPEQEPEPIVAADEDPYAAITQVLSQMQQMQEQTVQSQQQQQMQAQQQQILQQADQMAAVYRTEVGTEKYDAAAQHLFNQRVQELASFGYDEAQARGMTSQEIANGAMDAMRRGVNPGQMLMSIAEARGFSYNAPSANNEAIKKQTMGLGSGGGQRVTTKPGSPQDLVNMSDADFAKLMGDTEESADAALAKAMGLG